MSYPVILIFHIVSKHERLQINSQKYIKHYIQLSLYR